MTRLNHLNLDEATPLEYKWTLSTVNLQHPRMSLDYILSVTSFPSSMLFLIRRNFVTTDAALSTSWERERERERERLKSHRFQAEYPCSITVENGVRALVASAVLTTYPVKISRIVVARNGRSRSCCGVFLYDRYEINEESTCHRRRCRVYELPGDPC